MPKSARDLLPSAARVATTATVLQNDKHATSLRLYLNVTAVPGSGGLVVVIRGYDKISGNAVELTTGGDPPVTQTGTYAYEMGLAPDPPFGNLRDAASRNVPLLWDVLVKHLDGAAYTYSLSSEVVDLVS